MDDGCLAAFQKRLGIGHGGGIRPPVNDKQQLVLLDRFTVLKADLFQVARNAGSDLHRRAGRRVARVLMVEGYRALFGGGDDDFGRRRRYVGVALSTPAAKRRQNQQGRYDDAARPHAMRFFRLAHRVRSGFLSVSLVRSIFSAAAEAVRYCTGSISILRGQEPSQIRDKWSPLNLNDYGQLVIFPAAFSQHIANLSAKTDDRRLNRTPRKLYVRILLMKTNRPLSNAAALLDSGDSSLYEVTMHAPGPEGKLPLSDEMLRDWPSGDPVRLSQDAGMGWNPADARPAGSCFCSAHRAASAPTTARRSPWAITPAIGRSACSVKAAAEEIRRLGACRLPRFCTDPCDGRTQGTTGM